jgi:DNA-binding FadR family transcriptional regulator
VELCRSASDCAPLHNPPAEDGASERQHVGAISPAALASRRSGSQSQRPAAEADGVTAVAARSNPREVMRARLLVEPMLAQEAALNATSADLDDMRRCIVASRESMSWRQYENCDNRLHHVVAVASGNTVLRALFDQLNAIRRAVVWGRRRDAGDRPPRDHHSFAEHDQLVAAISHRDAAAASRAMRVHLESVEARLLRVHEAAD